MNYEQDNESLGEKVSHEWIFDRDIFEYLTE